MLRFLLAVTVVVIVLSTLGPIAFRRPGDFASVVADSISARLPDAQVGVARDYVVQFVTARADSVTLYLYRAYRDFQADSASLGRYLDIWVKPDSLSRAAAAYGLEKVVPVIWNRSFVGEFRDLDLAFERFTDELVIGYGVYDTGSYQYVSRPKLDSIGLDLFLLRHIAEQNLRRILPPPVAYDLGGAYLVESDGNLESSLLLLDEFWTEEHIFPIQGSLVVSVPAQNVLLVTGSDNPEGLAVLHAYTAEVDTLFDRPTSGEMLVRREYEWRRLDDEMLTLGP